MKGTKAYLIIFSYGKRYIEELSEFRGEYPTGLLPEPYLFVQEKHVQFSGISRLKSFFSLTGKNKKSGKKEWNKFLESLKKK